MDVGQVTLEALLRGGAVTLVRVGVKGELVGVAALAAEVTHSMVVNRKPS